MMMISRKILTDKYLNIILNKKISSYEIVVLVLWGILYLNYCILKASTMGQKQEQEAEKRIL